MWCCPAGHEAAGCHSRQQCSQDLAEPRPLQCAMGALQRGQSSCPAAALRSATPGRYACGLDLLLGLRDIQGCCQGPKTSS